MKILITGAPGTGKTTISQVLSKVNGALLYHTDVYKDMEWERQKEITATLILGAGYDVVVEGCTVTRGLDYIFKTFPNSPRFCDKVVICTKQYRDLEPRAVALGKRLSDTMVKLSPWLNEKGIEVILL